MTDISRVCVFGDFSFSDSGILKYANVSVLVDLVPIAKVFINNRVSNVVLHHDSREADSKLAELGIDQSNLDNRVFFSDRPLNIRGVVQEKLNEQLQLVS